MGIIPLQFNAGENAETLGLTGKEQYTIALPAHLVPGMDVTVQVRTKRNMARSRSTSHICRVHGPSCVAWGTFQISTGKSFVTKLRFDTEVELTYYQNGGILQYMLRKLAKSA